MGDDGRTKRPRDDDMELPEWWLKIAREKVAAVKGQQHLVTALGKLAGRTWERSAVSKFKTGQKHPGPMLVLAICEYFGIPRPFFIARTEDESKVFASMQQLVASSKPNHLTDAARIERKQQLVSAREDAEARLQRHSDHLDSQDEAVGRSRGRRPRRVLRGG